MSQPVEKKEASAVKDDKQKVPEVSKTEETVIQKILTNPWIIIGGIITTILLMMKGKFGSISSLLSGNNQLEKRLRLLESEMKRLRLEQKQWRQRRTFPERNQFNDDTEEEEEEEEQEEEEYSPKYNRSLQHSSAYRKQRAYYIK